jgi:hypothetical protein
MDASVMSNLTHIVYRTYVNRFVKQFVDIMQLQGHILALRNREKWPTNVLYSDRFYTICI